MKSEIHQQILNRVKRYANISLFVHERPDFDALGSAFAFKQFLIENFPNKKVYVVGTYELEKSYGARIFPFEDEPVTKEFLSTSLGIIFDTANQERIYTQKHTLVKEIIRIDHHPKIEQIGELEWINPTYSSTAEMIAWFLIELKYKLSETISKYLYAGLLTDTDRFLYLSTSPSTFQVAAKLLSSGFNRLEVHDAIYLRTLKEHKLTSFVINKTKITEHGCAYCVLPKNIHKRFKIHDAPLSMVHALNNILGVQIWTTLYFDNNSHLWKGSIRSRELPINQIAKKFNGGGHKLASGFSLARKSDFKRLIKEIDNYLISMKITNS